MPKSIAGTVFRIDKRYSVHDYVGRGSSGVVCSATCTVSQGRGTRQRTRFFGFTSDQTNPLGSFCRYFGSCQDGAAFTTGVVLPLFLAFPPFSALVLACFGRRGITLAV